MTFSISIIQDRKRYWMQVTRTAHTELFDEYTVKAGTKEIVFRNNEPQMKKSKKRGRMNWQVISKNWTIEEAEFKKASEYFLEVQDLIELHINPAPSFQQVRNKQ